MAGRRQIEDVVNDRIAELLGGTQYYVDSGAASDDGDGKSWASAFKTIGAAYDGCAAGDTLYLRGSFSETLTVAKAGLSLVGVGNASKQATWTSAADTATLTINANYVRAENVYFRPPAYAASTTYGPCAIKLGTSASYAQIRRNRFQGQTASRIAIWAPATGADNVLVEANEFHYLNTATYGAAILGVEASPWNAYSAWRILNNWFNAPVTAVNLAGRVCLIQGNWIGISGVAADGTIGAVCTLAIDLRGNGAEVGGNIVTGNYLGGTYSATLYKVAAASDEWAGNYNSLSGGVTADDPA